MSWRWKISDDQEPIIEAVKKRPDLYLKTSDHCSDVNYKQILWEEVCAEIIAGWKDLDKESQTNIGAEVQKRWFNIKTCFGRELRAQRENRGKSAAKRRKYIHFDKLLFLKPIFSQQSNNKIDSTIEIDNEFEDTNEPKHHNYNKAGNDYIDEDKSFAISLVPTLRALTEDEKLEAKIEILQVLRRIRAKKVHSFPTEAEIIYEEPLEEICPKSEEETYEYVDVSLVTDE